MIHGVLLPAIDPAGEDDKQQVPWLELGFHVPPDARWKPGASGISGSLSSVRKGTRVGLGKSCYFSHLRIG